MVQMLDAQNVYGDIVHHLYRALQVLNNACESFRMPGKLLTILANDKACCGSMLLN